MKAIALTKFGVPETLKEIDLPTPEIKGSEVLVEVFASSINPADIRVRTGEMFQMEANVVDEILDENAKPQSNTSPLPLVLGNDIAGIVRAVGPDVTLFKPGDHVMGLISSGAYSEYIAIDQQLLALVPDSIDFKEVAGAPTITITAWHSLFNHGHLQAGQRVLIHGGAGGVGHVAVQLAKAKGAYVITTVNGQNAEFVRSLGADEIIDYTQEDFAQVITEPVDLVFDAAMDPRTFKTGIPGELANNSYKVLKDGGMFLSIVTFALQEKTIERGIRTKFVISNPNHDDFSKIVKAIAEKSLQISINQAFSFTAEEIYNAYRLNESPNKNGRIILIR
ncbi:NADPH:quinone reductase [Acetoanaerobium noterae]|uniref:NADPH:quinone reductase n=1 Tax=Acetoanaerobium noterae TaxID=745369 RepID=A0A1T5DGV7_9FIRM|nr:NADP-dependent oxidoreductase [Acetoanaerobium noterae]SKB70811.1 NADPH:quinone reductase [Acetoanaerobium noterae]